MICTFYSYKGGVGRSMALANVADILSRRGLRVLMIDFDLEAPGLEQFFYRGDEREQRDAIRRQPGLLDLLLAYKEAMSVAGGSGEFREVDRYIASVFARRPGGGRLDLMPAGQRLTSEQLARYALALRSFDWQDFYFNWEGDLFFEWLRRVLVPERYDLVLIDSRTGVTEMGGICGYQLADVIVMMCGANHQNVDGTWSMLEDFRSQPVEGLRRGRPLEIVVVPARVEQRAPALLAEFYERFENRFGALLPARLASAGVSFRDLTVPYDPQFAFEERVARNPEEKAAKEHLGRVFGHLADVITVLAPEGAPPGSAITRVHADASARISGETPQARIAPPPREGGSEARYDETKRFADFDVLLSYAREDASLVAELHKRLQECGLRVATDAADGAVSTDWKLRMESMLSHVRALAVCLGRSPCDEPRQHLVSLALMAREAGRDLALLPILLPGHAGPRPADPALAEFHTVDLRHGVGAEAVTVLEPILRRPEARPLRTLQPAPVGIESEERCPYIGPQAFGEHHSDLFFGRTDEVHGLLQLLEAHPVVVLIGPSASGKSSLVRAGLFPALRAAHPDWKLIDAATANRVARAVAQAIPSAATLHADLGNAFEAISTRPKGSVLVAIDALSHPSGAEALTSIGNAPAEFPPGAARGALAEAVVRALAERGARVLLSLRSDELEEWTQAVRDTPLAQAPRVDLALPGPGAMREILERPADRAGLAFEPGLVDRLLSRTEGEPGVLPFLQTTLVRLWELRRSGWLTNAAYDTFGGLRGVVVEHADRHYEALAADDRRAMRRLLLRMIQVSAGGSRVLAQRVRMASMLAPGATPEAVLDGLIEARLLVVTRDKEGAALELAHEAITRDWPRLLVWMEQERDFLAWHHRLQAEREAWQAAQRTREQLLQGPALEEAERVSVDRGSDVAADIHEFITASVAERERLRSRRMRVRTAVASVFLIVALVAATGWVTSLRKSAVLDAKAHALQEQQIALETQSRALLDQLKGLEDERNEADAQRIDAQQRLADLQRTLDEALITARTALVERERTRSAVTNLEKAVQQTQEVAEQQQTYSINRAKEIDRQQSVIRNVLTRSIQAEPKAASEARAIGAPKSVPKM